MSHFFAAVALVVAGAVAAPAHSGSLSLDRVPFAGPVFAGRRGQLSVPIPRRDAAPVVDGRLDEPVWASAAVLTGFSQFFPADGVAANDSTEVLVWYSATALHVGIRAFAPTGTVRATLADRDRITQDDNVQLFLGTYGDSRQALVFAVNPFGIQSDGVLIETGAGASGGGIFGGTVRARENADLAPDYVWQSKGQLTPFGYEVELTIPFKSLRYKAGDEQSWQLHVIRTVQATGHEESWAPALRASASFLAQSGRLTGLRDLQRGLTLDAIPTLTSSTTGTPTSPGAPLAFSKATPELGGSVRWGVSSNLTVAGTANPDFSQVEADATQFTYDPRQALFFAERRPFFLESQEQFSTPSQLIYSRRIVQPTAAAKMTGKLHGFDVGVLAAQDSPNPSVSGSHRPFFTLLRLQRDLGSTSRMGVVYTDKIDGQDYNRVLGLDGRWNRGIVSTQGQVAASTTRRDGATVTAPLWNLSTTVNGNRHFTRVAARAIGTDFDAQSGFIARAGIANLSLLQRYTRLGAKGSLVESLSPEVYLDGTWRYDDLVTRRDAQDVKLHLRGNARLRGGWNVGAQALIEEFGYDRDLYRNYVLLVPRAGATDTVAYTGTPTLPNLDWVVTMSTPEFKRFSLNLFALWGQDENFPEWSKARIGSVQATLNVRPTEQLRLAGTLTGDTFDRKTDGTRVQSRVAQRLRVEYQVSRQVFVRLIGEISETRQDSLRDDSRTNLPVYLRDATGSLSRADAFARRRARLDALFSYLPSPGTVVYAGFGEALASNRPAGPDHLLRTRDVYFLKLSYLLRIQ